MFYGALLVFFTNTKCICLSLPFCSDLSFPLGSLFYSSLTVSQLIAAMYFPAFVSMIRMSATVWGKWCECVLHGLRLSELTAHKGAVIPCVKDCYWQGPFNLTPSKLPAPSFLPHLHSHIYLPSCFLRPRMENGITLVLEFCLWERIWS